MVRAAYAHCSILDELVYKVTMMKIKPKFPGLLLVVCWLLAACTGQSGTHLEHNGISLRYDPSLLGDARIQDVPATADQGLFDQPTPAHTRIGFAPAGTPDDDSSFWTLSRTPQVIVFNLSDFGSFAPADERARAYIAAFQQLLAERPSTFSDEVPILPLVNADQAIRAQVQWLDFSGGAGVRFVTAYSQVAGPVTNDRLRYIFYGLTADGLHGVVADFPLTAAGLPDVMPDVGDPVYAHFREHVAAEMTAVTDQLNNLPDSDFNPRLSQLDALVQSMAITPTETDYPVTAVVPQNGQLLTDTTVFAAPTGQDIIGALAAGDAIVANGQSRDGSRSRILCMDGTTGNCWIAADAVHLTGH